MFTQCTYRCNTMKKERSATKKALRHGTPFTIYFDQELTEGLNSVAKERHVSKATIIRLAVDHLPGDRSPGPLWLWSSRAAADADAVDRTWQAFLRRFDLEHTFRFVKQVLGWTRPKLRDPAAADRWTWLVIAAYAQLWLARDLAADIRLPWQQPCPPGRLTPARVRRGYRRIRQDLPVPASAPKASRAGPGRPAGSKNQHPATRHDVGKTVKREKPKKKTRRQAR